MASSRAEGQRDESTRKNSPDDNEILEAGTSLAGEQQSPSADPEEVAAPNATGVQQHGARDLPKTDRLQKGDKAVIVNIEKELKEEDENQCLLAKEYRDSEKEREEREEARRKRDSTNASNAVGSGFNAVGSASNAVGSGSNVVESASNAVGSGSNVVESASNAIGSASNAVGSASNTVEGNQDINDDPESCYIEIRNLVFIENSVIHKKALEEWERKEKLFTLRVERKSTKVENQKNEVYQLIGFFSVFQGVVLTAVSQSNLLHCNNLWSPISLSVLASIVTIGGVYQKLRQISDLEETIYSEYQALKDVVHRGQDLRREGKNFVFAKFSGSKEKGSKKGYSKWYTVIVLSFLLAFSAGFPLSHWRILCHSGRNPYGGAPPPGT